MVPKLLQSQSEQEMPQTGEKVTSHTPDPVSPVWAELKGHSPLIRAQSQTQLPKFLFPRSSAI